MTLFTPIFWSLGSLLFVLIFFGADNVESVHVCNSGSSDSSKSKNDVDACGEVICEGDVNSCVCISNGMSVVILDVVCLGAKVLSKNCNWLTHGQFWYFLEACPVVPFISFLYRK